MEFYTVIATLLAAVALSVCNASTVGQIGSGSYTDSLLGGVRRLADQFHARQTLGASVVHTGLNECNSRICPIGTICTLEHGVGRCVPRTVVAALDAGYGPSNLALTTGYGASNLALTDSYAAGINSLASMSGLSISNNGYGRNACGIMAPKCLATRRDFNPVFKYTFDHSLNRCVRVRVCMTCANLNSVRHNLFDSPFQCTRFCQL